MVTLRRRKRYIRKRKPSVLLQRSILIALIAIICISVTNIVLSSFRHPEQGIVMSATAASQDKVVKQQRSTVQEGIAQQVEVSKNTLGQLIDFEVPEQFQGKVIRDIQPNTGAKEIALTFDDGPWRKTTAQVLDILKKNNIKATFFWVGKHLQLYPDIAPQVIAEGHAIGNHTWSHQYHKFDPAGAAKEIEDTAALIYKTTGVKTAFFRPPGGNLKNGLSGYAQKNQYAVMMWSVDSGDSRGHGVSAPALINNVLKGAKSGGIVLMHDGGGNRSTTVEALPKIIEGLRKEGYKFVTLPELLQSQEAAVKSEQQKQSPSPANDAQGQNGQQKPFAE